MFGKFNVFDYLNRRRILSKRDGRLDVNIGKKRFLLNGYCFYLGYLKIVRVRVKVRKSLWKLCVMWRNVMLIIMVCFLKRISNFFFIMLE